jgi:hypothetical protein
MKLGEIQRQESATKTKVRERVDLTHSRSSHENRPELPVLDGKSQIPNAIKDKISDSFKEQTRLQFIVSIL